MGTIIAARVLESGRGVSGSNAAYTTDFRHAPEGCVGGQASSAARDQIARDTIVAMVAGRADADPCKGSITIAVPRHSKIEALPSSLR